MAREGAGLRWTVVTIDNGDEAKNALDRITIPQDVLDRIAPTAVPRSSIIISDEPLSRETNYRTEFVAVLSNQPQGGFITRRPPTTTTLRATIGTTKLAIRLGAVTISGTITVGGRRRIRFSYLVAKVLE